MPLHGSYGRPLGIATARDLAGSIYRRISSEIPIRLNAPCAGQLVLNGIRERLDTPGARLGLAYMPEDTSNPVRAYAVSIAVMSAKLGFSSSSAAWSKALYRLDTNEGFFLQDLRSYRYATKRMISSS